MTISSLYLGFSLVEELFKKKFGVFLIISKFPFLTIYQFDDSLFFKTKGSFSKPRLQGSAWYLGKMGQTDIKEPYPIFGYKNGHEHHWVWSFTRVFSYWMKFMLYCQSWKAFYHSTPPFAEGEIEAHRKEGICPKWNGEPEPSQGLTCFLVCTLDHCYRWVNYNRDSL